MKKLLRFLGFDDAEDERRRRMRKKRAAQDEYDNEEEEHYEGSEEDARFSSGGFAVAEGLIYFRGLATDDDKLQLRDALLDGCIVMLDLSGISLDQKEIGLQFITFMSGVAFANKGEFLKLAPALFSVSPRPGMVQKAVGSGNDR